MQTVRDVVRELTELAPDVARELGEEGLARIVRENVRGRYEQIGEREITDLLERCYRECGVPARLARRLAWR